MNKLTKYETIFIINPNMESEAVESTIEDIQNLITSNEGEITKVEKWGKKRLAYEVRGNKDGYYLLMNFMVNTQFIPRLGQYCRVTEPIIKYMTIRADDLPEKKREIGRIKIEDDDDEDFVYMNEADEYEDNDE